MKTNIAFMIAAAFTLTAGSMAHADTQGVCKLQSLFEDSVKSTSTMSEAVEQIGVAAALKEFLDARTPGDQTLIDWYKAHGQYGTGVEAAMLEHLKPIAEKFNSTYCNPGDKSIGSHLGHDRCATDDCVVYDANVRRIQLKADRYNKNGPSITIESCSGGKTPTCISVNLLDDVEDYKELESGLTRNLKKIHAKNTFKLSCLQAHNIDSSNAKTLEVSRFKNSDGTEAPAAPHVQAE
ncbi:MAG: hypothetical protein HY074_16055 [Deltaproteobacteria bacterium]|nr:hypothetical protein [Deltaproteobacteria bacterium]